MANIRFDPSSLRPGTTIRLRASNSNRARIVATMFTPRYAFGLGSTEKLVGLRTAAQATSSDANVNITLDRALTQDQIDYLAGTNQVIGTSGTKFDRATLEPADIEFLSEHRIQNDLRKYWDSTSLLYFEFGLRYDRWVGSGYVTNYNVETAVNDVAKVTLDIEANEQFVLTNVSPFSIRLGYSATEFDDAVREYDAGNLGQYYRDTTRDAYHTTGNSLYADSNKQTLAPAGFYADSNNVREWSGTAWTGNNKTR